MQKYIQNYIIIFLFLFVIPSAFAMETTNRVQDNKKLGIAVVGVLALAHLPKETLTKEKMNDILLLKQDMEKAEKWFNTFSKSAESTQTTNKQQESFLNNLLENGPMCIDSFSSVNFQQKNQSFSLQKFNGSTIKKNSKPYSQKPSEPRSQQAFIKSTDLPATPIDVRYIREEAWSEKIKTQNCLLM